MLCEAFQWKNKHCFKRFTNLIYPYVSYNSMFLSELPPATVLYRYIINVSDLAFRITRRFAYSLSAYFAKWSTFKLKTVTSFKHSVLNEQKPTSEVNSKKPILKVRKYNHKVVIQNNKLYSTLWNCSISKQGFFRKTWLVRKFIFLHTIEAKQEVYRCLVSVANVLSVTVNQTSFFSPPPTVISMNKTQNILYFHILQIKVFIKHHMNYTFAHFCIFWPQFHLKHFMHCCTKYT